MKKNESEEAISNVAMIPKRVFEDFGFKIGTCPMCDNEVDNQDDRCPYCDQKLKWSKK